tara:strand:+ start:683 stop:1528 length:846 start_codon:yes stop_codon:yes gene_type:complete
MDIKSVYCNNCGKKGHMYKDCRYPVLSCGNLLFRQDTDEPQVLMIQRKDSLCYIEFLRGKYDVYNLDYIQILIDKCNEEEKKNLLEKPYETLWADLWMITDSADKSNFMESSDYCRGYDKHNKLKEGYHYKKKDIFINLEYFIQRTKTKYPMTEWEFPKGRRNKRETNLECAEREFQEETNYMDHDYQLIHNVNPLSEEFVGENNVRYKYIYYLGYLTNYEKNVYIDPQNKDQVTELKGIKWFSRQEALDIIRDYHHSRRKIIHDVFTLIESLGSDYILVD